MEANEVIDEIAQVRSKNNKNWMDLMKLAFRIAPVEAQGIMGRIVECDKEVTRLCGELARMK